MSENKETFEETNEQVNTEDAPQRDPLNKGTENLSNYQYIHLDKDEVVRAIMYYTAIRYTAAALSGEVIFGFEFDEDIIGLFRNMPETKVHMGGAMVMIPNEILLQDIKLAEEMEGKKDDSESSTEENRDTSSSEESTDSSENE